MADTCYLFVYGTLRADSAHPMARFLAHHARLMGPARAPGRLYHLGDYPGMVPAQEDADWVRGDLFELKDAEAVLAALDRYEGCIADYPQPYLFRRSQIDVITTEQGTLRAWVYWYDMPVRDDQRILGGEYTPAPAAQAS